MTKLLADVGGTNARLALARDGGVDRDSIIRYRDRDHASFDQVLQAYLQAQGQPRLDAVCIAVAGPVTGGQAWMTNRDWQISESGLARATGAPRVRLINDLMALGYASASLPATGQAVLRPALADRARNGQSLVVGVGTGLNVCAVQRAPDGRIICREAEEGHTHLPANIAQALADRIGADALRGFPSTEETFAGRGLERLHRCLHGGRAIGARALSEAAEAGEAEATATLDLLSELFGLLLREYALRFMPLDGLWLAGSVARSLTSRADRITAAFLSQPQMRHIPQDTPLLVIRDDMAALNGCLVALT